MKYQKCINKPGNIVREIGDPHNILGDFTFSPCYKYVVGYEPPTSAYMLQPANNQSSPIA